MAKKRNQLLPDEPGRPCVHEGFYSELLGNARTVTVHLPPGYDHAPARRFPVLYLQDGQNVFEDARAAFGVSWRAGETADRLARQGRIPPVIIVGIDNTPARQDEYAADFDEGQNSGGRGELYGRFVVEEVKPFLDREYRTRRDRAHTAVAGSSMGGLAALAMARSHPAVFGLAAVLSPSLWWAGEKLLNELSRDHAWMRRTRFWLCMGTREGQRRGHVTPHLVRTRRLASVFERARLIPGRDYYYAEVAGGQHNEAAWAARFDKVLMYLFGW